MTELIAGQYWAAGAPVATTNTDLPVQVNSRGQIISDLAVGGTAASASNPVPVTSVASVGGGITWGAPTAVAVTAGPTSTTLIAANASRKAIRIWNPIGNAQMSYDLAGGTAVLATGTPLLAGDSDQFTGADCPVGAITFIGTAGQSLVYQQGT